MEYLDVKNSRSATEPSAQLSYASTGSEFAAFFSKKKPQRAKQSLFKHAQMRPRRFICRGGRRSHYGSSAAEIRERPQGFRLDLRIRDL
ncbi:Exocyst complex component 4 [Liparis tanakae]|uniref:Exocyst complex component 4 n=1 Tax=Liparis tanakae TaxID=230148 RepID=A0A4Z2G759_9TELE|nr:Exocyst complex component 4 [Liparis tanakae]